MGVLRRCLGRRLSQFLIKKTIYEQFVAGNTDSDVMEVVTELRHHNISTLLALPMEDDAGAVQR